MSSVVTPASVSAGPPDCARALGISTIFRDEAQYLAEWIEFHIEQGFSRFYLTNDQSTDDFLAVLEPWISTGVVTLLEARQDLNFHKRQVAANNSGLRLAKKECCWLAFVDVDEFLYSQDGDFHSALPKGRWVAGVVIWWRIFGSSGHLEKPEGGVLKNFTRAARFPVSLEELESTYRLQNEHFFSGRKRPISGRVLQVKSIVRPNLTSQFRVHFPARFFGKMVDVRGNRIPKRIMKSLVSGQPWSDRMGRLEPVLGNIRLNHYWSKSKAELTQKAEKFGRAAVDDYLAWEAVLNAELEVSLSVNGLARDS